MGRRAFGVAAHSAERVGKTTGTRFAGAVPAHEIYTMAGRRGAARPAVLVGEPLVIGYDIAIAPAFPLDVIRLSFIRNRDAWEVSANG